MTAVIATVIAGPVPPSNAVMTTSSTANMTYTLSAAPVADANTATATPAMTPMK